MRHLELGRRLCDYMDDKRQYGCAVTSEMCQFKALAITKELGITGFKATLHLCKVAASEQVLTWLVAEVNEFKKEYQARVNVIKNENEELLVDSHSILNRRKDYFSKLLNVHKDGRD